MSKIYSLSAVEVETLRRAAEDREMHFDPSRTEYEENELDKYGMAREGYTREELEERNILPTLEVTSFDAIAANAEQSLALQTPFGSGIKKWQLPIDMMPIRVAQTVFPPATRVENHVHPINTEADPGGGLRIVAAGSVEFRGKTFKAGDWFFVPNGVPYEFATDPEKETTIFYTYRFFGVLEGNRFSHPKGCD